MTTKATLRVKKWYETIFPDDECAEDLNSEITFNDVFDTLANYGDIYECLFPDGEADSLIRERIFAKLAMIMRVDPQYIYEQWYKCAK